jgi:hypothetical protein
MSASSNLIERLRNRASFFDDLREFDAPSGALDREAADHIASLEAENARLVKDLDQARAGRRLLSDQGMDIGAMFMNAQAERDAAEAENARLVKERAIFAKAFHWWSKWPEYKPNPDREAEYEADFAAARALTQGGGDGKGKGNERA